MVRGFCIAGALAAALSAARAQPAEALPPPRYTVQTDEPRTGSRIASTVVTGSRVPLNRTYAQLTDAEKRLVRSQYEVMGDADEPPYPLQGLYPLFRDVQKVLQTSQEAGELSLLANVDAAGAVTSVSVLRPGPPNVVNRVAQLLVLTRFKPALCGGQPCAMGYPLRVDAKIEH